MVIQSYAVQSNDPRAHRFGIKASGKRESVVYVIYLGMADYWSPSISASTSQTRQQQECWTLRLIKPELAEEGEKWREEGKKWGGEEHVSREPSGTWLWLQEWQLLQLTVGAQLHWELSLKNNWISTITHPSLLFTSPLSIYLSISCCLSCFLLTFITHVTPHTLLQPSHTHSVRGLQHISDVKFHRATYIYVAVSCFIFLSRFLSVHTQPSWLRQINSIQPHSLKLKWWSGRVESGGFWTSSKQSKSTWLVYISPFSFSATPPAQTMCGRSLEPRLTTDSIAEEELNIYRWGG